MADPLQVIDQVCRRRARLAAACAAARWLPPALLTIAVALGLSMLGAHTWERWGWALARRIQAHLQVGLWAAAAAALLTAALVGWRAAVANSQRLAAAELLDRHLGSHQTLITLVSVPTSQRSALFPLLWRHGAQAVAGLDPVRALPFPWGRMIRQVLAAGLFSFLGLVLVLILVVGLTNNPLVDQAHQLRKLAREMEGQAHDAQGRRLAASLNAAAAALDNPRLPAQVKLKQIAAARRELEQAEQPPPPAPGRSGRSGGNGTSGGTASRQAGNNPGKGAQGQGAGSESAGNGTQGNSSGAGHQGKAPTPGDALAAAQHDLTMAEAALSQAPRMPSGKDQSSGSQPSGSQPQPKMFAATGHPPQPNRKPQGTIVQPNAIANASNLGTPRRNESGTAKGDTHLGQFPQPVRYERFYKPGEGPGIGIKNARYVLFRIPPASPAVGAGQVVPDQERPAATLPFANLPLDEVKVKAEPQESQLIPPRYRELLR
ncbi:MAG TPA: hypothetical protein VKV28_02505 [Candidatus Binataceae bacterium]|nr:hypothetical protein [Candidatus Binataceae bacterium]